MPTKSPTRPVDDSLPKLNDELEVRSDLEFQRKWWRFEKIIWSIFTCIILLDIVGAFGHGFLAKAKLQSADGNVEIEYDRIARFSAPSIMTVHFKPGAIRDGTVQIWLADAMLTKLGTQRVVPQPLSTTLDHGGLLYAFKAAPIPDSIEFSMQPRKPGLFHVAIRGRATEELDAKVLVMP